MNFALVLEKNKLPGLLRVTISLAVLSSISLPAGGTVPPGMTEGAKSPFQGLFQEESFQILAILLCFLYTP